MAKRKISTNPNRERHPYKPARLVDHGLDLTKRWYILFYAWDVSKDKLVRKRLFEPINREGKTIAARLRIGEDMIRQINAELRDGKVLGKDSPVDDQRRKLMKITLLNAIQYVHDQKKVTEHRKEYLRSFVRLKSNFTLWLKHENRDDFPIKQFTEDDIYSFFNWVKEERGVGNRTHNNYRTDLATVFNFIMKRNPTMFRVNYAMIIDKLPTNNKKHAALTVKQMDLVKSECIKGKKFQLLLYIQMIYYTFARPGEVLALKISYIDLDEGRIFIPAAISKNRDDGYIGISPALKEILVAMDLSQYPPDYFVFAEKGKPGAKHLDQRTFSRRNMDILKKVGLDKLNHSVYSYKHTGVISLYKATKDIKLVQSQCRHKSLDQTNHYLRDLGLLSDYEGLKKWTGTI